MTRLAKWTLLLGAIPCAVVGISAGLVRGFEDIPPPKSNPSKVAPPPAARPVPSTRAPAAPLTPPPQVVIPQPGTVPLPGTAPLGGGVPGVEPRGERLEGFQRIGKQIFDQFVNPAGAQGPVQQKPVLPGEVNAGIQQMVDRLISGDRAIESFKVTFDPQETDFVRDKAKLNADVVLRHSAWSKSPSRLNIGLTAALDNPGNMAPRAAVSGELNMQTDVLALVNHMLPRIKKRLGVEGDGQVVTTDSVKPATAPNESRRPIIGRLLRGRDATVTVQAPAPAPAPGPENPIEIPVPPATATAPSASSDGSFKAQLREKLARTGTLKSMDELVDLVTYCAGLNICIQNEKIEGLMAAVENAQGELARRQALQELAEARVQRDAMLFTRLTINRDSEGFARGFEINMVDSAVATGTRIENLRVLVGEQEVKVSGATRLFQGLELYPFIKPLVMNFLQGLQNRDPTLFDLQRGPFSGLWRQGREAVVGPPEAVPLPQ